MGKSFRCAGVEAEQERISWNEPSVSSPGSKGLLSSR